MARSGSASGADGPKRGDRVRVAVAALDGDFRGVGLLGGAEVSTAGVLPGDVVEAEVEHVDRRGRVFARLLTVLEASRDRVDPACARFLDCSGCDLLHAPIELQHAEKRAMVARALGVAIDLVDPVIASPRALGYRALAKLVVGPDRRLGSYRARSHDVADMAGCVVHAPEVERVVDVVRANLLAEASTALRYVLVRASLTDGRALVTLVTRADDAATRDEIARLGRGLEVRDEVAGVYHHVNASSGDELLGPAPHAVVFERARPKEHILDVVHTLGSNAFAQVNPRAAERLYARAVELARPSGARVLDLYSGSGGLALQLVKGGAASVIAVEASAAAVAAAADAARDNGLADRVECREARAEAALEALVGERFDVVILNPPRKGAAREVLEGIARLAPARVVYVSCNPETLARDLTILRASGGFEFRRATPVDLFPATRHIETVVLAERASFEGGVGADRPDMPDAR